MNDNKLNFKIDYASFPVFETKNADTPQYPLILSIPHSGKFFPPNFLQQINSSGEILRHNEDIFVDELLQQAVDFGIPTIKMLVSRVFIDLNRDRLELDPQMFYNYPDNSASRRKIHRGTRISGILLRSPPGGGGARCRKRGFSRTRSDPAPFESHLLQIAFRGKIRLGKPRNYGDNLRFRGFTPRESQEKNSPRPSRYTCGGARSAPFRRAQIVAAKYLFF